MLTSNVQLPGGFLNDFIKILQLLNHRLFIYVVLSLFFCFCLFVFLFLFCFLGGVFSYKFTITNKFITYVQPRILDSTGSCAQFF